MTAALDRFYAPMDLRRASYSLTVHAVSWIPARAASEKVVRVAVFARRGRIIHSCLDTNIILAWMSGARLSQTGARCRRWGGSPRVPTLKALGGRWELGRNPRVRPVPEPEMSRKTVYATGEELRGGCVAEGDGGAAMVLSVDAEAGLLAFLAEMVTEVDGGAAFLLSVDAKAVLLAFLAAEVVREDMLREARKEAGGEKS